MVLGFDACILTDAANQPPLILTTQGTLPEKSEEKLAGVKAAREVQERVTARKIAEDEKNAQNRALVEKYLETLSEQEITELENKAVGNIIPIKNPERRRELLHYYILKVWASNEAKIEIPTL